MREIKIRSFAKINLSIDITGVLESGMHQVDMIMHQLSFHDDVVVKYAPMKKKRRGEFDIRVSTNRYYIPTDERNLAYKAVQAMMEAYGRRVPGGRVEVHIFKRIPVAAGLAGGSGNGAAVLHGLNQLWKLGLSLERLCELGAALGSDVPFCVMGQAAMNFDIPKKVRRSPLAATCGRATGTGTEIVPLPGIRKALVIAKPPIGVSTKEVYGGIDGCRIEKRPDNDALTTALKQKDCGQIYANCINVLENYTLRAYPKVQELKDILQADSRVELALMSGSGPTVFAMCRTIADAKVVCENLRQEGYEAYWTKTIK